MLESTSASSGPQKGTRQSGGCGGSSVLFPSRLKAEGGTGCFVFLLATCPQGVCPGVECFPGHGCQVTLVLSIRRAWSRSWAGRGAVGRAGHARKAPMWHVTSLSPSSGTSPTAGDVKVNRVTVVATKHLCLTSHGLKRTPNKNLLQTELW